MGSFKIHVDAVLQPQRKHWSSGYRSDWATHNWKRVYFIYAFSSVDMAEAHALTLRKDSDLTSSLQLSSVCMYEKRFIPGLESFSSSTDRSLRPIVSDVQQLLMSHHSWSV